MDDYQSDVRFGEWLKKQRERSGFSLEQAAQKAGFDAARLKSLEIGYAERGITRPEAVKLATAYRLPLDEILKEADRN